jgi:hypothetical protein
MATRALLAPGLSRAGFDAKSPRLVQAIGEIPPSRQSDLPWTELNTRGKEGVSSLDGCPSRVARGGGTDMAKHHTGSPEYPPELPRSRAGWNSPTRPGQVVDREGSP